MTGAPQPPPPRRGGLVLEGAGWLVALVVVLVLVVVAIGYVTVVAVFDIPWYAALPLSLLAGAGVVLWNFASSWKAWALAGLLVVVAVVSAFGWYLAEVA
jgi:hypothetical protein